MEKCQGSKICMNAASSSECRGVVGAGARGSPGAAAWGTQGNSGLPPCAQDKQRVFRLIF